MEYDCFCPLCTTSIKHTLILERAGEDSMKIRKLASTTSFSARASRHSLDPSPPPSQTPFFTRFILRRPQQFPITRQFGKHFVFRGFFSFQFPHNLENGSSLEAVGGCAGGSLREELEKTCFGRFGSDWRGKAGGLECECDEKDCLKQYCHGEVCNVLFVLLLLLLLSAARLISVDFPQCIIVPYL